MAGNQEEMKEGRGAGWGKEEGGRVGGSQKEGEEGTEGWTSSGRKEGVFS